MELRTNSKTQMDTVEITDEQSLEAVETIFQRPGQGDGGNHRALITFTLTNGKLFSAFLWALLLSVALLCTFSWLTEQWCKFFELGFQLLGLPGSVTAKHYVVTEFLQWDFPQINLRGSAPSARNYALSGFLVICAIVGTFFIPARLIQYRILVRVLAFFQGVALFFFGIWPGSFPYTLPQVFSSLLSSESIFLFCLPWVIGYTFSIFDVGKLRGIFFPVFCLAYFSIEIPVHCLWYAWAIHTFSLLYLPILFFFLGISFQILLFICLYSWALSAGKGA